MSVQSVVNGFSSISPKAISIIHESGNYPLLQKVSRTFKKAPVYALKLDAVANETELLHADIYRPGTAEPIHSFTQKAGEGVKDFMNRCLLHRRVLKALRSELYDFK